MKVLFVTQTAAVSGGVERWLASLCTGLAHKGVNVVLALVDGPAFHNATRYLSAFPELAALPHRVVRSSSGLPRGRRAALRKLIEECQPDIVVPVLVHEALGVAGQCKAGGQKLKIVYPVHENEVWAFDAVADNAAHIDAVISVNRLMLDALECFAAWPNTRSFHIRGGVDAVGPDAQRSLAPEDSNGIVIGFCGKLVDDQKRASDLIAFCEALDARARPYSLWIVGEGEQRSALTTALAKQIGNGSVRMLGTLTKEALYEEFYPRLDALLITSDLETGPLVAWEAMMHGVPVVTSAYRGLRREGLLRHNETALVYPVGEPVSAAAALCEMLDDRERFRQVARRGQQVAQGALTVDAMVSAWLSALEQVLKMPRTELAPAIGSKDGSLLQCAHDAVRGLLGRPLFHGNAHEEWPRYKPGAVPLPERQRFARRLDELELALSTETAAAVKKGRVLFIAPSAYPLGGVAIWLDYLVPALKRLGWSASVGLVAGHCHDASAYRIEHPELPAFEISYKTGSQEGRIRALESALRHFEPDIVVAVNIVDVYAAAQRIRATGKAIKVVMALHAIASDLLEDLRREAHTIDAVIATNRLACRLCTDVSGMPVSRVFYAPCGVDVRKLNALVRSAADSRLRIVWAGRIEQSQKRVNDIPDILSELDRLNVDYHFKIVGDGPDRIEFLAALRPWLQKGRAEYLGPVPAVDMGRTVYAHADVLLLTSAWETGPIVIWEAMAARVAVVTSRYIGSGREQALMDEHNCLSFPVGHANEAARQMARLAQDRRLLRSLASAADSLVAARYGIDHSVRRWAESLEAVMQLTEQPARRPAASARAGRLDYLLGPPMAETLRMWLGVHFSHRGAGGEWPHTAAPSADEAALLLNAFALDNEARSLAPVHIDLPEPERRH
jgi:glycosyltransferase involved in cell wall biosynthesis